MTVDELDVIAQRIADEAPPITPEQAARVRAILRPTLDQVRQRRAA